MSTNEQGPLPRRSAITRQQAIYTAGMAGRKPAVPIDYAALEQAAQRTLPAAAFAYIAGGAGQEATMANNRAAFAGWRIVPRMLQDVGRRDTGIELFGHHYPHPFLLCPIGVLEMAHAEADIAVARAAAAAGVPMIFSNQASRSMEACTSAMNEVAAGAPRWFQLYWSQSDALVESLIARASLDAVPEIVACAAELPVILDSGVRDGADAFKALALGATAVGLGRPYAYGLALAGETGVAEVIANLATDFELTMALSGCRDIAAIRTGGPGWIAAASDR